MATLTSVQSGLWSSGSTWDAGRPPEAGDQVVISSGHTIIYDVVEGSSLDVELGVSPSSVDVDIYGTLKFNPSATQPLRLRYKGIIQVRGSGQLICGTNDNPMPVKCTIHRTSNADGPSIQTHTGATFSFVGSPNVPYDNQEGWYRFWTKLASPASGGATTITVVDNLNWEVNDVIVMPRIGGEVIYGPYHPFMARVTAVDGNTLTLSSALPHSYPAGAEVAKVNRTVVLSRAGGWWHEAIMNMGEPANLTGFKWFFFYSWTGAVNDFAHLNSQIDGEIEYVSLPPNFFNYYFGSLYVGDTPSRTTPRGIRYHFGVPIQYDGVDKRNAINQNSLICGRFYVKGMTSPPIIENSKGWNLQIYGNLSQKIVFKDCTITGFYAFPGMAYYLENCTIYGFSFFTLTYAPAMHIINARNCKFYPISELGYSTTNRNRFDWEQDGNVIANYYNCEYYGQWVEPWDFRNRLGYDVPRVRFINKKVGNTIIKSQEFQIGGIITSDETMLPPDSNVEYTLKFEPKNPNLPIVYDVRVKPREQIEVWFYRGTGIDVAKVQIVELVDEFVANPLDVVPLQELDLTNYTAGQWHRVVIHHALNKEAILRFIVKGSAGSSLWVACSEFYEPALVFVE